MRKLFGLVGAFALGVALAGPASAGSGAIDNGTFTDPPGPGNAFSGWSVLGTGIGWTGGGSDKIAKFSGDGSGQGGPSVNGNDYATFVASLSQTITDLVVGATYTVTYTLDITDENGGSPNGGAFKALVDGSVGNVANSYTAGSTDGTYTLEFVAEFTSVTLEFWKTRFKSWQVLLDNVSIAFTAAPPKSNSVPGPIAGAGIPALLVAGAWLYRRRRPAA